MDRNEFLGLLRSELSDVSTEEREEALKFYNEYFDDAGAENEQKIISELGTAKHVATNIKANCGVVPAIINKQRSADGNRVNNSNRTLLIVIIAIVSFPVWIGFFAAAFGILVGGLVTIFALLFAGILMLFCGGIAFGLAFPAMAISVPSGMVTMGIALVTVALGCLFTGTMIFVIFKGIPACGRGIGTLIGRIFSNRRG